MSTFNKSARLILVRHGESAWNRTPTRFTGWADIPLTSFGVEQARSAGRTLAGLWNRDKYGTSHKAVQFHSVFTSCLDRSIQTHQLIREEMAKEMSLPPSVPVINHWRLNERHYGALVGLSKKEAEATMGETRVKEWRRSWSACPPPMLECSTQLQKQFSILSDPTVITHLPGHDPVVSYDLDAELPLSESLEDCARRVIPLLEEEIYPRIRRGENVLVVAHSNTIRGLIKYIDYATVSEDSVRGIVIPSAIPLVYKFEKGSVEPKGKYSTLGMTATFHVTQEALEMSLKAKQWLELSENLDHQGNEFQELILRYLESVKTQNNDDSNNNNNDNNKNNNNNNNNNNNDSNDSNNNNDDNSNNDNMNNNINNNEGNVTEDQKYRYNVRKLGTEDDFMHFVYA